MIVMELVATCFAPNTLLYCIDMTIISNSQMPFKIGAFKTEGLQLYYKETPAQVFSCEYWEFIRTAFL